MRRSYKGDGNPAWNGGPVILQCSQCPNTFQVNRAVAHIRKCCSTACKAKSQRIPLAVLICAVCKTSFERQRSEISKAKSRGYESRYCSPECRGTAHGKRQTGPANHSWKGGITPAKKKLRDSLPVKRWRKAVFLRDDYTCQHCGDRNQKGLGRTVTLHAHHIKSWAEYPSLRLEISNGLTLCTDCHWACHSKHESDDVQRERRTQRTVSAA